MSPNENVLQTAKELLSNLESKLVENAEDQKAPQREVDACCKLLTEARKNCENATLEAKAALERVEDWSRHLGLESDGGSIPQQEMLKTLQNKVEQLNEDKQAKTETLNRLEAREEQARKHLTRLQDQRKALIVQRDRAAPDVQNLLKS